MLFVQAGQVTAVHRMGKQGRHHLGSRPANRSASQTAGHGQPFDGRIVWLAAEAVPVGQQQDGQHICRAVCHADDVGADQFRPVKINGPLQDSE